MNKKMILTVVFSIIGLIIVFYIFGGLAPSITDSSNALVYPNNCSLGLDSASTPLKFNISSLGCYNSTSGRTMYSAAMYTLPLAGLFTPSGIMILLLVVAVFIAMLLWIIKLIKK